jgi:hypothetical protein
VLLSLDDESVRYEVLSYCRQKAHYGSDTFAFLDWNTLEDVLSIVRPASAGQTVARPSRGRIGAAMMAFLQCANIAIEPSVSLYENPPAGRRNCASFAKLTISTREFMRS